MDASKPSKSGHQTLPVAVQGITPEVALTRNDLVMNKPPSAITQANRPAYDSNNISRTAAGHGIQDAPTLRTGTSEIKQELNVIDHGSALKWNLNLPANAHDCRRIASIHMLPLAQGQDTVDHSTTPMASPGQPTTALLQINEGATHVHRTDTLAIQELLNNETIPDGWNQQELQQQAVHTSAGDPNGSCQLLLRRKTTQDTWHQMLSELFKGSDEVVRRQSTVTSQGLLKTLFPSNISPLVEPVVRKDTFLSDLGLDDMSNLLQLNNVVQGTPNGLPSAMWPIVPPVNTVPNNISPLVYNMPVSSNQPSPYTEHDYHALYAIPYGKMPRHPLLPACYASPTMQYPIKPELVSSPWAFGVGITPPQELHPLHPATRSPPWAQVYNPAGCAADTLMSCGNTVTAGKMHVGNEQPAQHCKIWVEQPEDVHTSGSSIQAVGEDVTSCSERHERSRGCSKDTETVRKRTVRECDMDKPEVQHQSSRSKKVGGKTELFKHRRIELESPPQSTTSKTQMVMGCNEQPCTPKQRDEHSADREMMLASKQNVGTPAKQHYSISPPTKPTKKKDKSAATINQVDKRSATASDQQPSSAQKDSESNDDSDNEAQAANRKTRSETKGEGGKTRLVSHPAVEKNRRNMLNRLIDELRDLIPPKTTSPSTHYSRGRDGTDHRPKHAVLSETIEFVRAVKARGATVLSPGITNASTATP